MGNEITRIQGNQVIINNPGALHITLRNFFFVQDPYCRKCGCKMTVQGIEEKRPLPNTITIEHIYNKLDIRRWTRNGSRFLTAFCFKCNSEKGHIDACKLSNATYDLLYPATIDIRNYLTLTMPFTGWLKKLNSK